VIAAASSGSARVIRALLNVANNVNEVMNPTKVHALHEAAKNGHFEAIKVIISKRLRAAAMIVAQTLLKFWQREYIQRSLIFLTVRRLLCY
jgi:hypothetical protein